MSQRHRYTPRSAPSRRPHARTRAPGSGTRSSCRRSGCWSGCWRSAPGSWARSFGAAFRPVPDRVHRGRGAVRAVRRTVRDLRPQRRLPGTGTAAAGRRPRRPGAGWSPPRPRSPATAPCTTCSPSWCRRRSRRPGDRPSRRRRSRRLLKTLGVVIIVLVARRQINSVVDGAVYGAFVGLGFQVVEDFIYAVNAVGDRRPGRPGRPGDRDVLPARLPRRTVEPHAVLGARRGRRGVLRGAPQPVTDPARRGRARLRWPARWRSTSCGTRRCSPTASATAAGACCWRCWSRASRRC